MNEQTRTQSSYPKPPEGVPESIGRYRWADKSSRLTMRLVIYQGLQRIAKYDFLKREGLCQMVYVTLGSMCGFPIDDLKAAVLYPATSRDKTSSESFRKWIKDEPLSPFKNLVNYPELIQAATIIKKEYDKHRLVSHPFRTPQRADMPDEGYWFYNNNNGYKARLEVISLAIKIATEDLDELNKQKSEEQYRRKEEK